MSKRMEFSATSAQPCVHEAAHILGSNAQPRFLCWTSDVAATLFDVTNRNKQAWQSRFDERNAWRDPAFGQTRV